jgi:MYXO-CTERM domain-containing protein
MQDLRNALVSMTGGASPRAASVQLGTRYPTRVIAVNPGPPSGSLRTEGTSDPGVAFEVANAEATGETGDFWNGTYTPQYSTGGLVYQPNYNLYGGAPNTSVENSVVANRFPSGTVALAGQTVVEGRQITLVAVNGSLDRASAGATSVDVRPVSSSTTTVSVSDDGSPITIRVPTQLIESTWGALLEDELNENGGNVVDYDVDPATDVLTIELQTGVDYTLRLAKAGVGTRVGGTDPAYMTDVSGDGTAVSEGGTQQLVLEVRDKFNNPVSGVTVDAEVDAADPGSLIAETATTGADGQVTFTYDAPDDVDGGPETATVYASYENLPTGGTFDATTAQDADLSVTVLNSDGSGGTTGGGEDAAYQTTWQNPSGQTGVTCDAEGDDCTLNADQETSVTLTAGTDPMAASADVSFARNRTDVGSLSATSTSTDSSGEATTTFSASGNGVTKIYAASGGSGDVINLTVENYVGTSVNFRVDDLTELNTDTVTYLGSYEVVNPPSNYDRVEVTFQNTNDGSATQTLQNTADRGRVRYDNGYGSTANYDVTIEVIDDGGTVVASETITDPADAANPTSENDDLPANGGTTLESYEITDKSGNGDPVRYRFDYTVSGSGTFQKVKLFALSQTASGDRQTTDLSTRSDKNEDLRASFGGSEQHRVGILLFDGDGVVVERVETTDAPSGGGEVVLTGAVGLLALLGITGLRRRLER